MPVKNTAVVRALAYGLTGLLFAWFAAALMLFGLNTPAPPAEPVDAVIVLGGSSQERLPVAQSLAADVNASLLVVSRTDTPGNVSADQLCREASFPSSSLLCFRPEGMDTRGEAAAIARLAQLNGWDSVAVVTSRYHVARAGTLIRQCTDAQVSMVASSPELNPFEWMRRFVIETGGLLDVTVRPEC